MKSRKLSENKHIIRVQRGEELVKTILEFCKTQDISFAYVSAIGAVSEVEMGYYETATKTYHFKQFNGDLEITSLTGNISQVAGEPFLHAHLNITDEQLNSFGGHLKEGVVGGTLEVFMEVFDVSVERVEDEETGLKLLDLD